jgi:hypothetical protein
MNPFGAQGGRTTHVLQKKASYGKSSSPDEAKEHVEANLSLPRLPLSLGTSPLKVSPTCIIRPKAKSKLASWVRLTSKEAPDQDLPQTRKLQLGRYFRENMDNDNFVLIAPQPAIAKPCVAQPLEVREVHRRQEMSQSVTVPPLDSIAITERHHFHLSRRDNPLRIPFANEWLQNDELNVDPDIVISTPQTTHSFQSLSPPPFRQESPMDGMNLPERLLLPSL